MGPIAELLKSRGLILLGLLALGLYLMDLVNEAIVFMQNYGWFVLFGAIFIYKIDDMLGELLFQWDIERSLQAANDPNRVDILRVEARKVRERQQHELEAQSKARKEAMATKKKEQLTKTHEESNDTDYNPLMGSSSGSRFKPSGFQRPSCGSCR
ncbi:hypothetical protein THRCLA_02281 [Thraustotheca clavata]|uniref:Selenoprotein S n=1 Tax=Thraustotheca clavata TaxID=74557 RepID=A0A1W0A6G9_9STRA|nr:hypothetical protein THRCLA_02281 [Thraustotheca clavata]